MRTAESAPIEAATAITHIMSVLKRYITIIPFSFGVHVGPVISCRATERTVVGASLHELNITSST